AVDRGLVPHRQGRDTDAERLAPEAMELATEAGDADALARAHGMLGMLASSGGDHDRARQHLEQSLALAEGLADPSARVAALNNLALAHRATGDLDQAPPPAGPPPPTTWPTCSTWTAARPRPWTTSSGRWRSSPTSASPAAWNRRSGSSSPGDRGCGQASPMAGPLTAGRRWPPAPSAPWPPWSAGGAAALRLAEGDPGRADRRGRGQPGRD